jgi:murein DD-endopeptidase MepM/ murein hydrolase activator NlpD
MIIVFASVAALGAFSLDAFDALERVCLPFSSVSNRNDLSEIKLRLLDGFGAYRTGGHKHAGLDIEGKFNESVYAIGKGIVKAVYGKFPYATVLIQHYLTNGEIVYSAYTHIQGIAVVVGQFVDQNTLLGRLFSPEEYKAAGFYRNHLHFEIRKTLEQYKAISIKCFSIEELNQCFYDPLIFFQRRMTFK